MHEIVLDTETTGISVKDGHRIVEIGCIELNDLIPTNNRFHCYLNPERKVSEKALSIHGYTDEFLSDKKKFSAIVEEFLNFIDNKRLIIHNAEFDLSHLNNELALVGKKDLKNEVIDTLILARDKFPGSSVNLDALCKRYEVDNSQRDLHGALLDAQILLDVYLKMTGGQTDLSFDSVEPLSEKKDKREELKGSNKSSLIVVEPSESEIEQHHLFLESVKEKSGGKCIWSENDFD